VVAIEVGMKPAELLRLHADIDFRHPTTERMANSLTSADVVRALSKLAAVCDAQVSDEAEFWAKVVRTAVSTIKGGK